MSEGIPEQRHEGVPRYEIRVEGHLHPRWSARFSGMSIELESDGTTAIRGPVADQSALHGLLASIRDLGLTIVAMQRIENGPE